MDPLPDTQQSLLSVQAVLLAGHVPNHSQSIDTYRHTVLPTSSGSSTTVAVFMDEVLAIDDPFHQKELVDAWMRTQALYFDKICSLLASVSSWCQKQDGLMGAYGGVNQFNATFPLVKTVTEHTNGRNQAALRAFTWMKNNALDVLTGVVIPYSTPLVYQSRALTSMYYCLLRVDFCNLVPVLNSIIYHRHMGSSRCSKSLFLIQSDWEKCHDLLRSLPIQVACQVEEECSGTIQASASRSNAGSWTAQMQNAGLDVKDLRSHPNSRKKKLDTRAEGALGSFWLNAVRSMHKGKEFASHMNPVIDLPAGWPEEHNMVQLTTFFGILVPRTPETLLLCNARPSPSSLVPFRRTSPPGSPSPSLGLDQGCNDQDAVDMDQDQDEDQDAVDMDQDQDEDQDHDNDNNDNNEGQNQDQGLENKEEESSDEGSSDKESSDEESSDEKSSDKESSDEESLDEKSLDEESSDKEDATFQDQDNNGDKDSDNEEEFEPELEAEPTKKTSSCRCTLRDTELHALLADLPRGYETNTTYHKTLVNAWYQTVALPSKKGKKTTAKLDFSRLCRNHHRQVGGCIGLKNNTDTDSLAQIIYALYSRQDEWTAIRSAPNTSVLFRDSTKLFFQHDDFGSCRYRPQKADLTINWDRVVEVMGMSSTVEEFKQQGTVNVDTFSWVVRDPELMTIVKESFDMYAWHSRDHKGEPNRGWLRLMFHSLIQQLMRGDVGYWLLYAVLRREHRLISYPYYTKYTTAGEKTAFRHMDCNLTKAVLDGVGARIIQGSVSWTDEDDENCTEVLVGFHRAAKDYVQWREKSSMKANTGYLTGWNHSKDWPAKFGERHPEVQWKKVPCSAGTVRVTEAIMPHGSTGPATAIRQTSLPWYVVHNPDGSMENPAMGTYEYLQAHHTNLTAPDRSPSGKGHLFGSPKWPFPSDTRPDFNSEIAKAIHCQVSYDSPGVAMELERLFSNPNKDNINAWIDKTRAYTAKKVKENWEKQKKWERWAYREEGAIPDRSFFSNREKTGVHPTEGNRYEYDGQVTREDGFTALVGGKKQKKASSK
jgi:hypothetical protein